MQPVLVLAVFAAIAGFTQGQSACKTAEGHEGTCVDIYSCPHLLALLKQSPPVTKEIVTYIKESRCDPVAPMNVCCGSKEEFEKNSPRIKRQTKCSLGAYPPDPSSRCCGVDASGAPKILSTRPSIDMYPWLALIEYQKGEETTTPCGGALISGRYVLTAAHCFSGAASSYGTPTKVRLGEYDTRTEGPDCTKVYDDSTDCTDGAVRIEIEKVISHPEYRSRQKMHNIALIKLKETAPYTDFIRPICLPTTDVTDSPPSFFELRESGWGSIVNINVKLHETLSYVNKTECSSKYTNTRFNVSLGDGRLCAARKGNDSCTGESGGPLMYSHDKGVFETIGVLSFGRALCGESDTPDVYTKVFDYKDWIMKNIEE